MSPFPIRGLASVFKSARHKVDALHTLPHHERKATQFKHVETFKRSALRQPRKAPQPFRLGLCSLPSPPLSPHSPVVRCRVREFDRRACPEQRAELRKRGQAELRHAANVALQLDQLKLDVNVVCSAQLVHYLEVDTYVGRCTRRSRFLLVCVATADRGRGELVVWEKA